MHSDVDEVPGGGREARIFERVPVRAFSLKRSNSFAIWEKNTKRRSSKIFLRMKL